MHKRAKREISSASAEFTGGVRKLVGFGAADFLPPDGAPRGHLSRKDVFTWTRSEPDDTPDALKHLERLLHDHGGAKFGRGSFKVVDLHLPAYKSALRAIVDDTEVVGGVDAAIVPYRQSATGALEQAVVIVELKRDDHEGWNTSTSIQAELELELLLTMRTSAHLPMAVATDLNRNWIVMTPAFSDGRPTIARAVLPGATAVSVICTWLAAAQPAFLAPPPPVAESAADISNPRSLLSLINRALPEGENPIARDFELIASSGDDLRDQFIQLKGLFASYPAVFGSPASAWSEPPHVC